MTYIDNVINKLREVEKKTIVLPESEDERVVEAAKKIDFANIILIGDKPVDGLTVINPSSSVIRGSNATNSVFWWPIASGEIEIRDGKEFDTGKKDP